MSFAQTLTEAPVRTRRLAAAGFVATAVAFGPARMGFGLFLPTFRDFFGLDTTTAGLIASGGFLGFLLALLLAVWLGSRAGQRLPVIAGTLGAAAGFATVALATNTATLAAGIALAGSSAGLCWAPFNDAAARIVPQDRQASTLSAVATGTTFGVMAAGGLALAVGGGLLPWRVAWSLFIVAALVAALFAIRGLPAGAGDENKVAARPPPLLHRDTITIYVVSLIYGASNAIYLSFAADRVVAADGLPDVVADAGAALLFLVYGLFGVLGLLTGIIEARTGLARLISAIFAAFAASLALVAVAPGSLPAVVLSAGLHGAAVMMISSVLSFWTLRIFPGRATMGFTAALIAAAAGSVLGPALAGTLITVTGARTAFLILAAPAGAVAVVFAMRRIGRRR